MIRINLNPKRQKKPSFRAGIKLPDLFSLAGNQNIIFIAIPAVSIVLLVVYYNYITAKIDSLNERKQQILVEMQRYKDIKLKVEALKKELEESEKLAEKLELKVKTYEYLSSDKIAVNKILRTSIESIPDGVWLEAITVSADGGKISGYAFQPENITSYYNNLSRFYTINIGSTESKTSPTSFTYYNFSLELLSTRDLKKEGAM